MFLCQFCAVKLKMVIIIIIINNDDVFSSGVISALKSLQDRIRDLEIERAVAAGKFKQLSDETRHSILSSGNRGDREVGGDSSDEDGCAASRETKSPEMRPTGGTSNKENTWHKLINVFITVIMEGKLHVEDNNYCLLIYIACHVHAQTNRLLPIK